MNGKRLLHSIKIGKLLSYAEEQSLDLEPLNVLIGPNASGKSNLIEALSILAAAPRDIREPIRRGGGVLEWIWKGEAGKNAYLRATVARGEEEIEYFVSFSAEESRFVLDGEYLRLWGKDHRDFIFSVGEKGDKLSITRGEQSVEGLFQRDLSMLAQLRDPINYPELTYVSQQLGDIRFFRGWNFGKDSELRRPQRVDLPDDFLLEDGSNLGLVLNNLKNRPASKRVLLKRFKMFYEGIEDFDTKVQGGTIQVFVQESGDMTIPTTRLSDGTLQYLCLLAILCHPEPPPLVCLEEPELGLHPDILPTVGDLLLEAAQRTQLLVTTHSETLVSRLSEVPETVIVCERDEHGTSLRRLGRPQLEEWLERYALGELWRMGEIGGNRW